MKPVFIASALLLTASLVSAGGASAQNEDSINYNASKSNTGNVVVKDQGTNSNADKSEKQKTGSTQPPDIAVKGSGVPEH